MNAFSICVGSKEYVLMSDKKNVTDSIAVEFINKVCEVTNRCEDLRKRAIKDRGTLEDFKRRINKCDYEEVLTERIHYIRICGKGFSSYIPYEEKEESVIVF